MKDPAFLFYPADYVLGTMGMTFEEKGAYMEILMMQFNRGHMTEHMIVRTIGQTWDSIKCKFQVDSEGLFYNKRLEIEQEKRKAFTESRRNNKEGKNQYSEKKDMSGHMSNHMGNTNKDINEVKKDNNEEDTRTESEIVLDMKYPKVWTPESIKQYFLNEYNEAPSGKEKDLFKQLAAWIFKDEIMKTGLDNLLRHKHLISFLEFKSLLDNGIVFSFIKETIGKIANEPKYIKDNLAMTIQNWSVKNK